MASPGGASAIYDRPMSDNDDLAADIARCAADVTAYLDARLAPANLAGAPERLVAAIRHGTLTGGKRLRPYLVRATASLFGVPPEATVAAGAAVECVHCYSLIHDDLPDMDGDEMRRGEPTVWRRFDPATAILAGDALLAEAFAMLAEPACHPDASVRAELASQLARGAGAGGMAGGQMLDLSATGGGLDADAITRMQAMKTGALVLAAVRMGATLGGASGAQMTALETYGAAAGLAYQLADDILDVTQSTRSLGKTAGKDAAQRKATIVALEGLEPARARLAAAVDEAIAALAEFGPAADRLRALARYFAAREH